LGPDARHVAVAAVHAAAALQDHPADLINVAIEELVRYRFELPAFSTLDRLVQRVRALVHARLFQLVLSHLSNDDQQVLEGGEPGEVLGRATLRRSASAPCSRARLHHWLTAPSVTPSARAIARCAQPCCFSAHARSRRPSRQSVGRRDAVHVVMPTVGGAAWFDSGWTSHAFIKPVGSGDTLTVHGRIRDTQVETRGTRVLLDVWCRNQAEKLTTVGSAGAFRQMAIPIAAVLFAPLIAAAAAAQEVVNFRFKRVLEHLAGSLAHQPLEHILWGGHRCGRGQNLIRFGHGVTLLKLARATEPVVCQREVTPPLSPLPGCCRRRISTGPHNSS
jgi:hypothetical protein